MTKELFETDVVISKSFEGASGESEYGPWIAYNFYIDNDERKFSWFWNEKKPIVPVQDMQIKLMEYTSGPSKCGKYINNNVSRIILHGDAHKKAESNYESGLKAHGKLEEAKPQSTGFVGQKGVAQPDNKKGRDSSLTMYISYAKDIVVALINNKFASLPMTVEDMIDEVGDMGIRMYDRAHEIDTATQEVEKGFLDDEQEGIRDDGGPEIKSHDHGPPEDQFPPFSE